MQQANTESKYCQHGLTVIPSPMTCTSRYHQTHTLHIEKQWLTRRCQ